MSSSGYSPSLTGVGGVTRSPPANTAIERGNMPRARSAATGEYVSNRYAKTHPKTTVIEKK